MNIASLELQIKRLNELNCQLGKDTNEHIASSEKMYMNKLPAWKSGLAWSWAPNHLANADNGEVKRRLQIIITGSHMYLTPKHPIPIT